MYIELEALPFDEVEINISLLAHIAADWWCNDKSGCPDFLDHLTHYTLGSSVTKEIRY